MKEFFTRQKANEGVELPLFLPTGEATEHTLTILGVDSDQWHKANREFQQQLSLIKIEAEAIEDLEKRADFLQEKQAQCELNILAALISDWTFEEECNEENIKTFLTEAPQIAQQVNKFAGERKLFFNNGLKSSDNTQGQKLKTVSQSRAQTPQPPKKSSSRKSTRKRAKSPRN